MLFSATVDRIVYDLLSFIENVWPCISDVPENVCDPDELAAFIEDGILVLEYYTVIVALSSIFVSVAPSFTGNSPWP